MPISRFGKWVEWVASLYILIVLVLGFALGASQLIGSESAIQLVGEATTKVGYSFLVVLPAAVVVGIIKVFLYG